MRLAAFLIVLGFVMPAEATWHDRRLVVEGKLAAVYVEPVLYRRPDRPDAFFVSIWYLNTSRVPVAIDDQGPTLGIHPNQWSATDARRTVDERTLVPGKLDAAASDQLRRRMKTHGLSSIPPGGSQQSYVPFSGPGWREIDRASGRHVVMSFDGQAFVTDGTKVESLTAKAGGSTAADLVLSLPIAWHDLPAPPAK